MSLDWDLSGIKDYETVCWVDPETIGNPLKGLWQHNKDGKAFNPHTHNLIWATMGCGIGLITEENVDEFFFRLHVWEKLRNMTITPYEVVKQHIGLRTNVFPKETRTKWINRLFEGTIRDLKNASAQNS